MTLDILNTLLIFILFVVQFAMHREHSQLWYFHKHDHGETGEQFRKYIRKD